MPSLVQDEKSVYQLFRASVLLKGAISVGEILAGIAALVIPLPAFLDLGSGLFVAVFLISRGLIKALLIGAMLYEILWAYPASLVVLAGFVAYQAYLVATAHSVVMVGVTLFDLVVMYFIWREWAILRARLNRQ